jgi:transcriptional regulator with XRE-family HTH domain
MTGQDRAPKGSPRRTFGRMLRFYRVKAGLSRETLADLAHISASTIVSYETGWRVPTRPTVVTIEAVPEMNTGGALIELWDELEEGMTYQVLRAEIRDWAETVEAVAATLRWFEAMIVPGLLQTEEYMRAIFSTRFGLTAEGIEERIAARLQRQEVLKRDNPPALWVIIDEAVLRRPVGGRHVMREQVNKLIEAARQPSIRIEVVPISTGAHEGLYISPFILADFENEDSVACMDTSVAPQFLKNRKDIAELDLLWATLKGEALPRGASLALLEEAAKSWSSAT